MFISWFEVHGRLNSSGRLVGTILPYDGVKTTSWCRVTTEKLKKVITKSDDHFNTSLIDFAIVLVHLM